MTNLTVVQGVSCYEKDGVVYLRLEDVAKGLGFTKTDVKFSETGFRKEYVRIDWPRVKKYIKEFNLPVEMKSEKDDYIPENVFYRLAMKAKNDVAEAFQAKVADEIIPSIRKTGMYVSEQNKNLMNSDSLKDILTALQDVKNELSLIRKFLMNANQTTKSLSDNYKSPSKAMTPWRYEVYSIVKPLAKRMNTTTKAIVSSIYNRMKKDYGWDFASEKLKYFSANEKVSGIDVVEESEMFKSIFMSILKDIYEQNTNVKINENGVVCGSETGLVPVTVQYTEVKESKHVEDNRTWDQKASDLIHKYAEIRGDKSVNHSASFRIVFASIDPITLNKIEIKYIKKNGRPSRKIKIFNYKRAYAVIENTVNELIAKENKSV